MRLILTSFLILSSLFQSQAQNLVPNGDLEDMTCLEPFEIFNWLHNWYLPTAGGTTDYFNTCANTEFPNLGIPSNLHGWQVAHSGDGYVGFGTWQVDYENSNEVMRVELESPLEAGAEYQVSCYLSLAEVSSVITDQLHFLFTDNDFTLFGNAENDYVDEVQVTFDNIHEVDSISWFLLQDTFIADGGETYLTIGDLRYDNDIDTSFIGFNNWEDEWLWYTYYYIDDISVVRTDIGVESLQLNDFGIRQNSSILEMQFPISIDGKCNVYYNTGQLKAGLTLDRANQAILSVSDWSSGIYFIQITTETNSITKKVYLY